MLLTIDNVKATLPLDPDGNVFMELYSCVISPDDFVGRFDGATLDYASLYAHPNATTGWKNQFDAWKAHGTLN